MNTDKLMELERKWRGMNCRTEAQDRVYRVCADQLAALRAEQAVGEEQRARELLAEAERGPICDYGTVHRQVAHSAIRRALGTARQSEPRQNFMGKGQTIAAQVLHAARQSEGVVLTDQQCDAIYSALNEFGLDVDQYEFGLPWTGCDDRLERSRSIIRLAAAPGGEGEVGRG